MPIITEVEREDAPEHWTLLPKGSVLKRAIEAYSNTQWPVIFEKLKADHGLTPVEPNWAAPGEAWYWQEQIVSVGKGETRSDGWARVKAPAGSASLIAHYLDKGFRLRHPTEGDDVEVSEAALPPEGPGEPTYYCERHRGRKLGFKGWSAYAHHLAYYQERAEYQPEDMAERRSRYPYYCDQHEAGFASERIAARHVRLYTSRGRRHPSVADMEVPHGDAEKRGTVREDGGQRVDVPAGATLSELLRGSGDARWGTSEDEVRERGGGAKRPRGRPRKQQ